MLRESDGRDRRPVRVSRNPPRSGGFFCVFSLPAGGGVRDYGCAMISPNEPVRLVVGLGNPGREYERTRHNAGFWFIDALARAQGKALLAQKKFFGDAGRLTSDCWMLKPTAFMNRSGQAVAALAGFYQIAPEQILVVHDELDLKPGEVKMKLGGGVAGHNGLKDIQARLGTADFWRLRIGIGHPREQELSEQEVIDYVLHRPSAEHQKLIDATLGKCLAAWPLLARGEMERAMHQLHTRPKPPRAAPAPEQKPSAQVPAGSVTPEPGESRGGGTDQSKP
jgi:peptidyl-tRNA hydrolase, PTH1 family